MTKGPIIPQPAPLRKTGEVMPATIMDEITRFCISLCIGIISALAVHWADSPPWVAMQTGIIIGNLVYWSRA